jgi:hypothetical protein
METKQINGYLKRFPETHEYLDQHINLAAHRQNDVAARLLRMVWEIEEGGKEVLFPSTITLTDPSRASGNGFHNSIK